MMYPLVLDLADDGIPVAVTCRVLGFSKQAFYKWRAKPVCDRDYDDAHLVNAAVDVHHDDPEFGYRFITDELAQQGWTASRNRVNRLCTLQKLWSVHARRQGSHRRPGPPVYDDSWAASSPPRRRTGCGSPTSPSTPPRRELYLCAVKDACSKRIVGYSIDARMTSQLAVDALRNAIALRAPDATAIVHSDRGSQFRSHAYQQVLREAQLQGSMGRVGTCADNAAMESFLSLLQKNVLNRRRWRTRAELRLAIVSWIETTYHRRRRQDTLGRLTPVEFEILASAAHAA
ncbi:IS3 family transposase [Pseudonocardia sp. NPDC049154]|uniref:IS3 family transposase n=1 Tax=Pseudonocardia sp. NPDC049154 TaxID=3155501 RepID=UPI0033C40120